MLNTRAQTFLQQYKLLRVRAQSHLERLDFWQAYDESYCSEIIAQARDLLSQSNAISTAIESADITEQYRTFLRLRFIEGLTLPEIACEMDLTRRWLCTIQQRALEAFGAEARCCLRD